MHGANCNFSIAARVALYLAPVTIASTSGQTFACDGADVVKSELQCGVSNVTVPQIGLANTATIAMPRTTLVDQRCGAEMENAGVA